MSKILLIDDDREVRLSILTVLKSVGHYVLDYDSAIDAMRAVTENEFDIAIIDILMPDVDGLELINQLNKERPNIKMIAISGDGNTLKKSYLPAARAFGAMATLEKPFEAEALIAAVTQMEVH